MCGAFELKSTGKAGAQLRAAITGLANYRYRHPHDKEGWKDEHTGPLGRSNLDPE